MVAEEPVEMVELLSLPIFSIQIVAQYKQTEALEVQVVAVVQDQELEQPQGLQVVLEVQATQEM